MLVPRQPAGLRREQRRLCLNGKRLRQQRPLRLLRRDVFVNWPHSHLQQRVRRQGHHSAGRHMRNLGSSGHLRRWLHRYFCHGSWFGFRSAHNLLSARLSPAFVVLVGFNVGLGR